MTYPSTLCARPPHRRSAGTELSLTGIDRQSGHPVHNATDEHDLMLINERGVPELHVVTKAQTHVIESTNSGMRDNLARLNRRSKR